MTQNIDWVEKFLLNQLKENLKVFISEKTAAQIVERKPRTLRKKVKSGEWKVEYRHINGRRYQYNQKQLESIFRVEKSSS